MDIIKISSENFESEVVNATGTVLVDFWAEWCGPCRMLAPILEEVAAKTTAQIAKVNVDTSPDLAAQFGVMSIPTMVIFQNGKEFERVVGVRSAEDILEMLPE